MFSLSLYLSLSISLSLSLSLSLFLSLSLSLSLSSFSLSLSLSLSLLSLSHSLSFPISVCILVPLFVIESFIDFLFFYFIIYLHPILYIFYINSFHAELYNLFIEHIARQHKCLTCLEHTLKKNFSAESDHANNQWADYIISRRQLVQKLSEQQDKAWSLFSALKPPQSTVPRFSLAYSLNEQSWDQNLLTNFCEEDGFLARILIWYGIKKKLILIPLWN